MDLDDFLFIVRAGGTVRATTAKGDTLASGWSWGVAGGGAVEDETAFHDCEGTPEKRERTRLEEREKGYRRGEERNDCSVVSCFILMRPQPYWVALGWMQLPLTGTMADDPPSDSGEQPASLFCFAVAAMIDTCHEYRKQLPQKTVKANGESNSYVNKSRCKTRLILIGNYERKTRMTVVNREGKPRRIEVHRGHK